MSVIATDVSRFSNVVKHEYLPSEGYCRQVITVNETANITYDIGTVLGLVTATGQYKRVESTAADGSQTAAAIYIGTNLGDYTSQAITAATPTTVVAITRGPAILVEPMLEFGASISTQAARNTQEGYLANLGIIVIPQN